MSTITHHKLNGLNDALQIEAGPAGAGGAPVDYSIKLVIPQANGTPSTVRDLVDLHFQNGSINSPTDYNGLTNEALLAILIDRTECFQAGPFACHENAQSLLQLKAAMVWLQKRTRERIAREVEGKQVQ